MMTCATPCESYTHRQGRCECGTNATRAALGLPPLHQDDGGHEVNGRLSFPLHRAADWSEQDEPLYTAESVLADVPLFLWALCGIAAVLCVLIQSGALDHILWRF